MKPHQIVLGITGSIAAYKAATLTSQLCKAGADVRVVMTPSGTQFMTPVTMQTLSGNIVRVDMFEQTLEHIELAKWADYVLVAPASANCIARIAHGFADDLLTSICLATEAPIGIAPAMNKGMWQNPATQANIATLKARNIAILGPASGMQACGDEGMGRMLEPEDIASAVWKTLS